ncbi:MAG: hypothetical protein OZSIB_1892 [Candidatus Ozemobacter sibiricus]|uniref:Uncharacterized protein n=1 Tax=Candidatus Ozemobacter sibiricus TaxID=2268124 RepID=A0A367ZIM4_9BACT|nr:MAG: hypothetical protein OZSIB_1892 [Candidatus Ozemobacter sibiricus]
MRQTGRSLTSAPRPSRSAGPRHPTLSAEIRRHGSNRRHGERPMVTA